jgi:SAP domain
MVLHGPARQEHRPGAVALAGTPTVQGEATGETDLEALTVAELQDLCDARGLPRSGTKAELVERLRADGA